MLNEEFTKVEIRKIVNDELDKAMRDKLKREIVASLKSGAGRGEVNDIVKNGLNALYKFLWTKRSSWNNEIK